MPNTESHHALPWVVHRRRTKSTQDFSSRLKGQTYLGMASIRGKSSHVLILLKIGSCQDVELNLSTSPCEILSRCVRMRRCLNGCLDPAASVSWVGSPMC